MRSWFQTSRVTSALLSLSFWTHYRDESSIQPLSLHSSVHYCYYHYYYCLLLPTYWRFLLLLFAYFTITVCECVLAAGQNRLPSAINKELIFFMCQSGDPRTAELKSRRPGCAAELIWLFYMFGDCLHKTLLCSLVQLSDRRPSTS